MVSPADVPASYDFNSLICPSRTKAAFEHKRQFPQLSSRAAHTRSSRQASNAERERLARNLAEAIDDLYAMTLQLVTASAYLISCRCKSNAFWQLSERQRNERATDKAMRPGR
jgi:hypothetical protein